MVDEKQEAQGVACNCSGGGGGLGAKLAAVGYVPDPRFIEPDIYFEVCHSVPKYRDYFYTNIKYKQSSYLGTQSGVCIIYETTV